jgi:hypothetical protein
MFKSKLFKYLILPITAVLLLLVIAYNVVTSSGFLCSVVLPAVSKEIGLDIAAKQADISLLRSTVVLRDVTLKAPKASEKFASAKLLKGKVGISSLLNGDFKFSDVLLDKADFRLVKDEKGHWNYSDETETAPKPQTQPQTEKQDKTAGKEESSGIKLELKNIQIKDSSFELITNSAGVKSALKIAAFNAELPELVNDKKAQLKLSGDISISSGNDIKVRNGKFKTAIGFILDKYLHPSKLNLMSNISELKGEVSGVVLDGSNIALLLNTNGSKDTIKIKNLILRQVSNGSLRSSVSAKGSIGLEPFSIDADIKISPLSEEIFGVIVNFASGINPGLASLKYDGHVEYKNDILNSSGNLLITRKGIAVIGGKKYALPTFVLKSGHDFKLNLASSQLQMNRVGAEIVQNRNVIAMLSSRHPFLLSYGEKKTEFKGQSPEFNLLLTGFNVNLLKLFIPPQDSFLLKSGWLDANVTCRVDKSVDGLAVYGKLAGRQLALNMSSKELKNIELVQTLNARLEKMNRIVINNFATSLKIDGTKVATLNTSGFYALREQGGELKFKLDDFNNRTCDLLPFSSSQKKGINKVISGFDPFRITAVGALGLDFRKNKLNISRSGISVTQHSTKAIQLQIQPVVIPLKNANWKDKIRFVLKLDQLRLRQFDRFLAQNNLHITSGSASGAVQIALGDNGQDLNLNSDVALSGIGLRNADWYWRNLALTLKGGVNFDDYKKISLNGLALNLYKGGRKGAEIAANGALDLQKGKGKIICSIPEINQECLNLFVPNEFSGGKLRGLINFVPSNKFKQFGITGNIEASGIASRSIDGNVSGKIAFNLNKTPEFFQCKEFSASLKRKGVSAVQLEATAHLPTGDSNRKSVINVKSREIDVLLLEKLFSKPKKAAPPIKGKRKAPDYSKVVPGTFDIGKHYYVVNLDLKGISYTKDIKAFLKGRVAAYEKQIVVNPLLLNINGTPINSNGKFYSTPKGVEYAMNLKSGKLQLGPVVRPFVTGDLKQASGAMDKLTINIKGRGLKPPFLWDNMKGNANAQFEKISVPNAFSKTLVGSLILLPFEILGKIQAMMPGSKKSEKLNDVVDFTTDFNSRSKIIRFNKGKVRLEARDGRIFIYDFNFTGDFVRELDFQGYLGLGSYTDLRANSKLNVDQIIMPVKLTGTIYEPKANLRATLIDFLRLNTLNVLDVTGMKKVINGSESIR